jgi:polyhydroxyalkanoate synthesis regulator phasin
MEFNDTVQKVVNAGIGLALVTKERAEQAFDELAEKGKSYKTQFEDDSFEEEEDDADFTEEATDETEADATSEEAETKSRFVDFEQLESKAKQVLDATLARLHLAKSDVEETMEARIDKLESKLGALVDAALETMDLERKSSKTEETTTEEENTDEVEEVVAEEVSSTEGNVSDEETTTDDTTESTEE